MLPLSLSLRRFRAFEEEWVGSMIPNVNMPKCYEQNNISSEMIPLTESANRNNTHSRTGVAPRKMVYRGITQFCPDERGLDRPPCLNSTATRMRGSLFRRNRRFSTLSATEVTKRLSTKTRGAACKRQNAVLPHVAIIRAHVMRHRVHSFRRSCFPSFFFLFLCYSNS